MNMQVNDSFFNRELSDPSYAAGAGAAAGAKAEGKQNAGDPVVPTFQGAEPNQDKYNVTPPTHQFGADKYVGALGTVAGITELLMTIAKCSAEDKKMNREQVVMKLDQIAEQNKQVADKMRDAAVASFVTSVVSSAVQIGAGALSLGMSMASINKQTASNQISKELTENQNKLDTINKTLDGCVADKLMTQTERASQLEKMSELSGVLDAQKVGEMRDAMNGLDVAGKKLGSYAQFYGELGKSVGGLITSLGGLISQNKEADVKEIEAQVAKMQAAVEALKSYTESLEELRSKANESAAAIMRSDIEANRTIFS